MAATTSLGFSIFSTFDAAGTNQAASGLEKVANVAKSVGKIAGVALAAVGGFAAKWTADAVKAGLASNELQQRAGSALNIVMGSAQKATEQMSELRAFGSESPISMSLWIQAQQQMLAFGVEATKVVPLLQAIQNTALAGGGTEAEIQRIIEVMARMSSSAEVTKGDLNVLGTQGVAAAQLVGNAFGKTANTIVQEVSSGSMAVDDFYDGFITGADRAFAGVSEGVRQTFAGVSDRLRGVQRRIGEILATPFINPAGGGAFVVIGNAIADTLNKVEKAIKPVVEELDGRFQPAVNNAARAIRNLGNNITTKNIENLMDRLSGLAPVASAASAALGVRFAKDLVTGIPVLGAFGAALSAPATAIAVLAATSPELRSALQDIFKSVTPLIPPLTELAIVVAKVLAVAIQFVAPLISLVATNLQWVVPAAVAAAGAMAVYGLAAASAGTASTVMALGLLKARDAAVALMAAIAANPIGVIAAVIGTVVVALSALSSESADATEHIQELGKTALSNLNLALEDSSRASTEAAASISGLVDEYSKWSDEIEHIDGLNALDAEWWNTRADAMETAEANLEEVNTQLDQLDQALAAAVESGKSQAAIMDLLSTSYGLSDNEIRSLLPHMDSYQSALNATRQEQERLTEAVGSSIAALQGYADELRAQADPAFAAIKAQQDYMDATATLNDLLGDSKATQEDVTDATMKQIEAYLEWTDAAGGGAEAIKNGLTPELEAMILQMEGGAAALEIMRDAYEATGKEIDATADAVDRSTAEWLASQYDLESGTVASLNKITGDVANTVKDISDSYDSWTEKGAETATALEKVADEYGLTITEVADIVGAQTDGMSGYVEDWVLSAKGQIDDLIFQGYSYSEALATVAQRTGKSTDFIESAFGDARDAGLEFSDDYPATVRLEGVAKAIEAAKNVQRWLNNIDRQVTVSFNYKNFQPMDGVSIPRASGGIIRGPGTGTSDSVPVRASNGEFMIQKAAVDKYGAGFLSSINSMAFAGGGLIRRSNTSTRNVSVPAGGGGGNLTLVFNGPVSSKRQAQDMVIEALKDAQDSGRIPKILARR